VKKNISILVGFLISLLTLSCNNSDKKHVHDPSGDEPKTLTDSLEKDIDEGHIVGMSKIGKLHNTQKEIQRIIDSIGTLPAKAKAAAAPYLEQLNKAIQDLSYADFAMDKWMTEYDMDSAKTDLQRRIKYLAEEKLKVDKMKEAILTSMQKADSLLKTRF
jgi:hypothetical protein